ncbi:MAG: hypothetical protein O4804_01985 [Trichodesmium sp. St11_bin5]|nr:hypothetical protein [Trichodesmium sp. St11_bin5]
MGRPSNCLLSGTAFVQFQFDIIPEVVRPPNTIAFSRFDTSTAGWVGDVYLLS